MVVVVPWLGGSFLIYVNVCVWFMCVILEYEPISNK
jgi:hypothetical protein